MSAGCSVHLDANQPAYRRILWLALIANAVMFVVELFASWHSGSVSLQADALDFFGDAANYAISLSVLGLALAARAKAALFKALCMALFGLWVLGTCAYRLHLGLTPDATIMGLTSTLALLVNVGVAWMLFAYREGDSNMRSVWLCSRNDAIANVAVMIAAVVVYFTASLWPDIVVAGIIATLALTSSWSVAVQAHSEITT